MSGLVIKTPSASQSMTWQFQGLTSGTGSTLDAGLSAYGSTVVWSSDGTGQFVRVTYGGSAAGFFWNVPSYGHRQLYVKVDMRRNTTSLHSKYCKFGSWWLANSPFSGYSNMTYGNGYSTEVPSVGYADSISGNNDQGIAYQWNGVSTGSTFTRATPTLASSTNYSYDTGWHTYEYFCLQNSDSTADGVIGVQVDGTNLFLLKNAYNCANGQQSFAYAGIGEWSNNSGFTEDFRNLYISYDTPSWAA